MKPFIYADDGARVAVSEQRYHAYPATWLEHASAFTKNNRNLRSVE
jgi:hypothetical protein